jgi:hypothetical protein
MPIKVCGLGFDCPSMMQCPGIKVEDCLNWQTCGSREELTEEERQAEIELVRIRREARERWLEENPRFQPENMEVYHLSWQQAVMLMLMARGNPQTAESFGIAPLLEHLEESVTVIRQQLERLEGQYIAPEECELHRYNVKRPSRPALRRRNIPEDLIHLHQRTFCYNKLTSQTPTFRPNQERHYNSRTNNWEQTEAVRSLHTGRDDNPKNQEAQKGIARRNTLLKLRTMLDNAESLLREAATMCLEEIPEALPPVLNEAGQSVSPADFWDEGV